MRLQLNISGLTGNEKHLDTLHASRTEMLEDFVDGSGTCVSTGGQPQRPLGAGRSVVSEPHFVTAAVRFIEPQNRGPVGRTGSSAELRNRSCGFRVRIADPPPARTPVLFSCEEAVKSWNSSPIAILPLH